MNACPGHDIYAGLGRVDCAVVVRALFACKVITKAEFVVRAKIFKNDILTAEDKSDWVSTLRENSFDKKLPGKMQARFQILPIYLLDFPFSTLRS